MSVLTDFFPTGGGKLRFQEFLTSGTFTPSAKLLADGGWVFVQMAGGGGGGGAATAGGVVSGGNGGTTSFGSV